MSSEAYRQTIPELLESQQTNLEKGLTSTEAQTRLERFGPNSLREKKRETMLQKLLNQFKDFMVLILIVAAIVSGALGEWIDSAVILAIVVINAILGIIQEGKAEKAIEALQKMASPQARVLRDGQQIVLDSAKLVPGDIVILEAGDVVPADVRLFETASLKAEEASLTGESVPVEKDARVVITDVVSLGDRVNMAFMSTAITYGRGRGLIIGTGSETEIGSIADRLQDIDDEMTPLQKNLNQLGKYLGIIVLVVSAIVFIQGTLMGGAPLDMFMTAVSLAVAAIPEGLPAVVTIVLALGMRRMAEENAIVKRLLAVETLGSVDVICSDKTGTLTQNEMTVTRAWCDRLFEISGVGYAVEGEIKDSASGEVIDSAAAAPLLNRLLTIGLLCNDAALTTKQDGNPGIIGDPTEGSLLVAAGKFDLKTDELCTLHPRIGDLPFDSERKMMTTFHSGFEDAPVMAMTKGAPDVILNLCSAFAGADGEIPMTAELRQKILEVNSTFATSALRVLAFATRRLSEVPPEGTEPAEVEQELTFAGLMGMIDPARPEARDAIAVCTQAGIRAIMITGDYRETAVAIAQDLGLMKPGDGVLSGLEIDQLSDEEMCEVVEHTSVYARVSPDHKVRILSALRGNGHIASMTGDGVNDAMALKKADIGVAMGITGTDVAKNTADMILTDDNFATIVRAVEEGRIIYSNIRKFVAFLLSCNIGEILVIFITSLLMGPAFVPLVPIQLLWLNLVTDSFPALALGQEKGEPDIMDQQPRDPKEPILNKPMIRSITLQSIAIFAAVFTAFRIGMLIYPNTSEIVGPSEGARTYAFITLIMSELIRSFSARSERVPVLMIGLFSNPTVVKAFLLSTALTLVVVYLPFMHIIFNTTSLTPLDWLRILPLAVIPFAVGELEKLIYYRRRQRLHGAN
ncbi:MAG: cation-translocating P-type ATPase [Ruminococcaceae bacterium]|nr:cation-translocating P-type ATPase [Oscillospiraceae bacterium]